MLTRPVRDLPLKSRGIRTLRCLGTVLLGAMLADPALAADVATFVQPDGTEWNILITPRTLPCDVGLPIIAPAVAGVAITPAEPTPAGPVEAPAVPPENAPAEQGAAPAAGLPLVGLPAGCPVHVARCYERIYRSIPYSYTEYLANPSYRHEATMEILFGQLRPTVIHKTQPAVIARPLPYGPWASPFDPFGYYDLSRGPYTLSRGLFGYEGGWRPMYYLNGGYGSPYSPWF